MIMETDKEDPKEEPGATLQDDTVPWSAEEVDALINSWSENAAMINQSRNENAMNLIAADIGTNKTAKQVRNKIKKMRGRFIMERDMCGKGGISRWRYYDRLKPFQHLIVRHPNRKSMCDIDISSKPAFTKKPPSLTNRQPIISRQKVLSAGDAAGSMDSRTVMTLLNALKSQSTPSDTCTAYPFDPDVPGDVAIETSWQTWNENLKYPLSENGIRCLLRSGFSEISHLNLLRDSKANLAMLNLNYHDKLALEHALDAEAKKTQQIQLLCSDGSIIELESLGDQDQSALVSTDGIKMAEWNKDLPVPLSSRALTAVLGYGFLSSNELTTLLTAEDIQSMDLSLRDKAILRSVIKTKQLNDSNNMATDEDMTDD